MRTTLNEFPCATEEMDCTRTLGRAFRPLNGLPDGAVEALEYRSPMAAGMKLEAVRLQPHLLRRSPGAGTPPEVRAVGMATDQLHQE
jgi:hypothetical protein